MGGAGVAFPAGNANLIKAVIFFWHKSVDNYLIRDKKYLVS